MCNSPVFLLSLERSGSTLLRYILDAHPELGAPGELALGHVCSLLMMVCRRLNNGEVLPPDRAIESEARRVTRSIIDNLMNEYLRKVNKRVWCEKSPMNVSYLTTIEGVFPDARFICLYRNCLDTASSSIATGRFGFMPEQQDYILRNPGDFVRAMVQNWLEKTERLLRFEKMHRESAIRVRYEDIVANPTGTIRPITEFLGLRWLDRIVLDALTVPHFRGGGDQAIKSTTEIHSRSIGKGRKLPLWRLSPDLIRKVNRIHRELQYEALQSPVDKLTTADL